MMAQEKTESRQLMELQIDAETEYVAVVREAVRKVTKLVGLNAEDADGISLALDEALANVIAHGYGGSCDKPIIVRLLELHQENGAVGGLELVIRDFGKQIDPANIKGRDLEDVRPGGLGVHIIRSVMDEVEYSCPAEGGMQLRMIKRLNSAPTPRPESQVENK